MLYCNSGLDKENISNITKNTIRAAGSAASAAGLSATDPSTWSNLSLDSASKIGGAAASQLSTELEFAKPKEQIIGSVSLYMPDTIVFDYSHGFETPSMSDVAGGAQQLATAGKAIYDGMKSGGSTIASLTPPRTSATPTAST